MSKVIFFFVWAAVAFAHEGQPLEPHDLWEAWTWDPLIVAGLGITGWAYLTGARRERGIAGWEAACFWAGWFTLFVALLSPLHPMGEALFSAHMAQHELIMALAAPLLVLGRPLAPFVWSLPGASRRPVGRWLQAPAAACGPFTAWMLHLVVLWGWHVPALFEATLTSELVHSAQHLSFLFSALLFWWALIRGHGAQRRYGAAVFYIFTTAIHTGLLGAWLTFAPEVWYPAYSQTTQAWGLTPLEDQQLGGLIMWVPAGVVYVVAGVALFHLWMRESDRRLATGPALVALLCIGLSACARAPQPGKALIIHYGCGSCHTIPGVPGAAGVVGPPLTGFARRSFIAGRVQNTPGNAVAWIRNPKQFDEKTAMPAMGISHEHAVQIARYLNTLR